MHEEEERMLMLPDHNASITIPQQTMENVTAGVNAAGDTVVRENFPNIRKQNGYESGLFREQLHLHNRLV